MGSVKVSSLSNSWHSHDRNTPLTGPIVWHNSTSNPSFTSTLKTPSSVGNHRSVLREFVVIHISQVVQDGTVDDSIPMTKRDTPSQLSSNLPKHTQNSGQTIHMQESTERNASSHSISPHTQIWKSPEPMTLYVDQIWPRSAMATVKRYYLATRASRVIAVQRIAKAARRRKTLPVA